MNYLSEIVLEAAKAFLLMTVIVAIMFFAVAFSHEEPVVVQGPVTPSKEAFKKAHRYHGVDWSEMIDGQWCFWRNGEALRLFAYLEGR